MPTIVQYHDPDEFLHEMETNSSLIEDKIVRVTGSTKPSGVSPNISLLSVVATYKWKDHIVRLDHFCGELWRLNESKDQEVVDRAKKLMSSISAAAKASGLEVRDGLIKPAQEEK